MNTSCIICGNSINNSLYKIKELQLGLGELFNYQLCGNCGTMQLQNPPQNFEKYYPNDEYYSFNLGLEVNKKPDTLRKIKSSYLLFNKNRILGPLLSFNYKMPDYYEWVKNMAIPYNASILDIGTGNGSLLLHLFKIGFTNLTGIDPFINESKNYGAIKILKKTIFDVADKFDAVMMHHSLEHMFEPEKVLQKAYDILNPGGKLLIRIPVMGNYGWKRFGEYWCGIDAPRHIFIPSEKGLKLMVEKAGFTIDQLIYDSSDYVIWSSEQYEKGIPLADKRSHMFNANSPYSKADIKKMRAMMKTENENGNGDTIAIYLHKK
jgi:SAM-dependent methyltransferase